MGCTYGPQGCIQEDAKTIGSFLEESLDTDGACAHVQENVCVPNDTMTGALPANALQPVGSSIHII